MTKNVSNYWNTYINNQNSSYYWATIRTTPPFRIVEKYEKARLDAGLTQLEVAEKLGVAQASTLGGKMEGEIRKMKQ